MSRTKIRASAVVLTLMLLTAACASDDSSGGGDGGTAEGSGEATEPIDYEAIGLWDDGPCDEALDPLQIGLMTVFESPVISLGDQAVALEAAADAFNQRGGANGACIEVHTCDDGGNADQSLECVREIDDAGVVATVNDQGTQGQADVSDAMSDAGIPRVASLITPDDWADPNTYPMDAGARGSSSCSRRPSSTPA
jgi:ABC-type branched-subunit amino acid transport system substrate-binding protein